MSALSAFGFRIALPLSPKGVWAVGCRIAPFALLPLSFLLSPQQAAAQAQPGASAAPIISQNASSTPDGVSLVLSPASITEAGGTSTVTARLGRAFERGHDGDRVGGVRLHAGRERGFVDPGG